MNSSNTITKIAGALLKAQKEMADVAKGATNPYYKSSYADLNSIRGVTIPALNAQGVSILQPTITLGDRNFVETILLHESGEFISGVTEIKNVDGKPQSEGSGISYARRYGLQSMLNVGAVDDDGEIAQGRSNAGQKETKISSIQEKSKAVSGTVTNHKNGKEVHTTVQANVSTKQTSSNGNGSIERPIKKLIEEAVGTLVAQGRLSVDAFKTNYLSGKGLSTTAPSEYPVIYEKLKKDYFTTNGKGA